jgi:hypothetical protein
VIARSRSATFSIMVERRQALVEADPDPPAVLTQFHPVENLI